MHKLPIFSFIIIPLAAAACGDDPTPITISTVRAPEAIAYRDGLDGAWQTLTPSSPGSYKVDVSGPYMVSVVCSAGSGSLVAIRQIARTPEDGAELDLACAELPQLTAGITGTVAQAGSVSVGSARAASATAGWALDLDSPAGTFDLIGVSADRIMLRRDIAVSGQVDLGAIDIDQQGMPLVPAALTASNAAADEELAAEVLVTTPKNDAGWVHQGAPASAKIAPTAFLSADVRQSVAMIATKGDATRSVRRDFKAGDPTAFALPAALGAVQFAATGGKLVATWSTLPEHDAIVLSVAGSRADDQAREHALELSQHFVAATGATSAALDTELPGFQAAWRIDLGREHVRELRAVRERDGEHAASATTTVVAAQP
jgi:hypothetical protein